VAASKSIERDRASCCLTAAAVSLEPVPEDEVNPLGK
jgi:hypothetical protein